MTFQHGKSTGVLVGGYDLSAFFNQSTSTRTIPPAPVTTYGNDDEVYIAGVENGRIALGGFFDGDADAVDEVLATSFVDELAVTVAPQGFATLGNMASLAKSLRTNYDITSPIGGAVTVAADMQAADGLRNGGVIVHALQARTGTFDGTHHDGLAASSYGAAAHLHLTALTGTDIDVRLQHTADDPAGSPVWADLVAWTSSAAVGATRTKVTGTVQRYLRVIVDGGTFTSATFMVAVARNRR